ncbi:hypothetical protein KC329_g86 [Hortaea werneckii]|nr:hypothetical protein KC329_g86 [Hortaea werneckii]
MLFEPRALSLSSPVLVTWKKPLLLGPTIEEWLLRRLRGAVPVWQSKALLHQRTLAKAAGRHPPMITNGHIFDVSSSLPISHGSEIHSLIILATTTQRLSDISTIPDKVPRNQSPPRPQELQSRSRMIWLRGKPERVVTGMQLPSPQEIRSIKKTYKAPGGEGESQRRIECACSLCDSAQFRIIGPQGRSKSKGKLSGGGWESGEDLIAEYERRGRARARDQDRGGMHASSAKVAREQQTQQGGVSGSWDGATEGENPSRDVKNAGNQPQKSRPLTEALSESPSRENLYESFSAYSSSARSKLDGYGPYRSEEIRSDSLDVGDGSSHHHHGHWEGRREEYWPEASHGDWKPGVVILGVSIHIHLERAGPRMVKYQHASRKSRPFQFHENGMHANHHWYCRSSPYSWQCADMESPTGHECRRSSFASTVVRELS